MKTKHCPKCDLDLPKEAFTSTRAKYCIACKRIRQLEQQQAMMKRSFEKSKAKPKKIKKKKRKKNSPRKILENKLDVLSARYCRLEKGACEICGKSDGVLNAHHFKSRIYKGVRWYQPNLICLCVHHHTFDFNFSAHKTPKAFKEKMIKLNGQDWLDDIQKRAREHTSFTTLELQLLLEDYEKKLKKLAV